MVSYRNMKVVRTETEKFHFLKSKSAPFGTGWKHGNDGESPTYNINKKYDCLKSEYVNGYAQGINNRRLLDA